MKTILYSLFAIFFLASCSKSESGEINTRDLNQEFIGAWNARDSDKVISMMADDVQFLQGEVLFRGKSEVSDKWVRETMGTIADLKLYPVSSGTDTKMAYEAGTFSVDVLPEAPGEPRGLGEGNFMLLWKKMDDGNWKLSYAQLEGHPVVARN
jgi:ketosteroid isomerase-like protein